VSDAPYAVRRLDFQFALGTGSFGGGGSQKTISLTRHRAVVTIEHAQIPDPGPTAIAKIYGMTLDEMNALSVAGLLWVSRKNEVVISAGDDKTGMNTIFKGIIQEAYPDFSSMPETFFFVRASPGPLIQLKPSPPLSYNGAIDVATVLGTMAKNAGLALEQNGVSAQLASPYFSGSTWDQIVKAVKSSNLYGTIDSVSSTLAVWAKNGKRAGETVTLSPDTGMIGYPQFSTTRVIARAIYGNKLAAMIRGPGKPIKISSQLKAADGEFVIAEITYTLTSELPGGPWELAVVCYPPSYGPTGG
jgi:hypothetical protein